VLVILLIALIVLGPQRLPGVARQAGKVLSDLRRMSSGFQNELRTAFEEADTPPASTSPAPPAAIDDAISAATEHAQPAAPDDEEGRGERAAS
jgi:sec-independent protein translocase protein TatB